VVKIRSANALAAQVRVDADDHLSDTRRGNFGHIRETIKGSIALAAKNRIAPFIAHNQTS
jgi:hypothetical protein